MPPDTLPKLLLERYRDYGDRKIAMRRKDYGIWIEYTWKDYYENTKYFSLGLIKLGLTAGDKVAVLGENDPEWYWSALAVQSARAACVGIFPDSIASEVEYIINNSDSVFVVAEDQEQTDKILEIKERVPQVRNVIYWDPKGMYVYRKDPFVLNFYDVVALGREYEKEAQGLFENNVEEGAPDDIGVICYTSGTTGAKPKGAMGSQKYLVVAGEIWCAVDNWSPEDDYLSYLSPAWATEWVLGLSSGLRSGTTLCFPEKPETVQSDIREIGPKVVFYSARMWESLNSTIHAKIADTLAPFRLMFNSSLKIGYRVIDARFQKKPVPLSWRALYKLADRLVFRYVRDRIGLSNIKWAYTAGASISPDILRFFHAIGVNLKQIYGLTEALMNAVHRDGDIKPESCGVALPGNEFRISENGELLVKPPACFSGYYKDPEATKKQFDKDGWIKTGDAAHITPDNHLVVLGRMKELIDLGDGNKFSPEFIETRLRFSPYIKDVMTFGEAVRPFVCAIVVIDYENVGKWAEDNRLNYTTFADLSQKPEVSKLILKEVERINSVLPDWSKIRRYVLMHKEFDPDEAELTRTRKLRRAFMVKKYKDLIDGIYSDAGEVMVEAAVTYRDGRKGVFKTAIKIRDVGGA
ncbi:MAG: AMP-binding protein [Deltaproteobacteria bacterium]|nr:AMP-binding protein [Deltaproteobacteria bacterium]